MFWVRFREKERCKKSIESAHVTDFFFFFLETLRKYPPISSLNRECTRDYRIPGTKVTIEKGTLVVTSVLGFHRDPDFYADPEEFRPERFSDEEKAQRNRFTYLPFGEGPRICIGTKNLVTSIIWPSVFRWVRGV